jgi:hypothetical protein
MFSLRASVPAHTAIAVAERCLRPADRLDYVVRRWLIPVPLEDGIRSIPNTEASIRRIGLSSDIQNAIGRCLRAKYTIERSMPTRLADLLREFERQNNTSAAIARDGHAGVA